MHGNWGIILVVIVYVLSVRWINRSTKTWEGVPLGETAPREKQPWEYSTAEHIFDYFLIANMWTLFIPTFMIGKVVYNLVMCGGWRACG